MLKKIRTYQTLITLSLILSFCSIFICDYLCDMGVVFPKTHLSHKHAEGIQTDHHHDDGHHHAHSMNEGKSHDFSQTAFHDNSDENEDPCCEDFTSVFYASLFNNKIEKNNWSDVSSVSPIFLISYITIRYQYNIHFNNTPFRYFNLPPPIRSLSFRVFLQSFLN